MPKNYYFGGGGDTFTTPLGLLMLAISSILILALPRKYVIIPLLAAGLLLPDSLRIVVMSLHFISFRLLLLAGWMRVLLRRDIRLAKLTTIDKLVLACSLCNVAAFVLLWGPAALISRLGFLYSILGAYFLVRALIRNEEDVLRTIKVLAIVLAVIAPCMLGEKLSGHNVFALIGAAEVSSVRAGAIRAQGPFAHAIIAGTVGATLLPLFVGMWWQTRKRWVPITGICAATVMTLTSASSTPVMAYAAGVFALLLWPARRRLRWMRWGLAATLVALHLAMKAPVWFLLARMGSLMGGSGWHRAMLIDNLVRHFGDWWLIGTRDNATWGYDMWDAVNAYVGVAQGGGLLTLALYIAIFVYAYKRIGQARKRAGEFSQAILIWAVGCSLFANTVAFFGIAYFDQSVLAWYALLAIISAAPALIGKTLIGKTATQRDVSAEVEPATLAASWTAPGTAQPELAGASRS
jgi:hypothetical protein